MKKNVGPLLALYPTPVTIIGSVNGGKPTWTLVAHVGIIGHDRVLISLAARHFINGCIKETGKLSVNLVSEDMLPEADYVGSVSGAQADKSAVFEYDLGDAGTPVIRRSPLTMECSVADIYETPGFESFVCTVDNTYVAEEDLDADGKVDYSALKPVLFEFPTYRYLRTGGVIGKCLSFKRTPEK